MVVKIFSAVTWHPVHPILVSGGSEGSILHWDLSTPDPDALTQPVSSPRAMLSQAHDSNVWSLTFHPFGHILVSGSNDNTTRFWSRERPGDVTSVFLGGGEKPPEVGDTGGQDEDEESMVPGLGFASTGGNSGTGVPPGLWWNKDEELDGPSRIGEARGGQADIEDDDYIPGFGTFSNTASSSVDRPDGRSTYATPSNHQESSYDGNEGERGEFGRDRDTSLPGDDDWRRGRGGYNAGGYVGGSGYNGYNRGARHGQQRRGGRY